MEIIEGNQAWFDFESLTFIADLIYIEGPLLSLFINRNKTPYLFYWVDNDDNYNRWLFFPISIYKIREYINQRMTLLELYEQQEYFFSVDISNDLDYTNIKKMFPEKINEDYKPFNKYFDNIDNIPYDTLLLSAQNETGLMEIHITGENVGYGSIPIDKLNNILSKFNSIRKHITNKEIKNKITGHSNKKRLLRKSTGQKVDFRYIAPKSASFSILLKPSYENNNLDFTFSKNMLSDSDYIADAIINYLKAGDCRDGIEFIYKKYGKTPLLTYTDLVSELEKNKINVDIHWLNFKNSNIKKVSINDSNKKNIIKNLIEYDIDSEEILETSGQFYMINKREYNYGFKSDEDDFSSTGKFNDTIKEMIGTILLKNHYHIRINRLTTVQKNKKTKYTDTLLELSPEMCDEDDNNDNVLSLNFES